MTRIVLPPGWPRPRGYANGMAARGELLAIAGQIGWDERETLVGPDFVSQFRKALDNVATVVESAGGKPSDIVSITIYVVDRDDYRTHLREVGEIWRARIGAHYPAMALVVVAGLLEPAARVEIQGLAVLPTSEDA